ncbi:MAG TPA: hypothetical protein VKN82_01050 [Desulfohalobiaceae bacterium]|nr:hypothetical protein [Desulfohalobiaceae bacterium]
MVYKIKTFSLIMFTIIIFVLFSGLVKTTEAALQPIMFLGVVEDKNVQNETITVKDVQWVSRPDFDITRIVGETPNKAALQNLQSGHSVIVCSLGKPENFVSIAKFKSNIEQFVTDIYGEIEFAKYLGGLEPDFRNKCPFPFPSGHFISYTNKPDCKSCFGAICQASETKVVLENFNSSNLEYTLKPGQDHSFQVNNNQIYVKFLEGEVSSSQCQQQAIGPQPKSNFVVRFTSQLSPEIHINGSKGPVDLYPGDPFELTVDLKGKSDQAGPVDYWILAYASIPNQWWSFVIREGNNKWVKGIEYCIQMPICPLNNIQIPNPPLHEHLNIYFFAIDNNANGHPDANWFDSAALTCTCDPSQIIFN